MKIKTKLQITSVVSLILALVIGSILFFSAQQVNKAIKRDMAADEIIKGLFELNILTNEYLMHHEERAKTQWQLKHDSIKKLLEKVEIKGPEETVFLKKMREDYESIKSIFSQIVSNYEGHGDEKEGVSQELNEILMDNLETKSCSMVSDVYRMAQISSARLVASQQRAYLLVVLFTLIMAAVVAGVSLLINRGVVKPIRKLHEGTEIIGAGNLDYKVSTTAKDEVGQLSRAFDRMTIQLKESFAGLEKEIAERKRAAEVVRNLNAELEQRVLDRTAQLEAANKELEAFSYSVSHDLRAPLRSIDGFSQALLEDCPDRLDEQSKNYLNRVRSASQRMGRLIDDLLKLSRVTRTEMRRETVDMTTISGEISEDLQKTQPERQAEFVIPKGLVAMGDARLLRVVLDNLIGNAWKFTGKQPKARIEFGIVQRDGEKVYFVRDNGAGFDMAYSGKLFAPFQRLHSPAEFPGTGIGLATVQRIIHRHGGKIWAEGEAGKGATFYFTLP